jgi:hypothetical protein
VASWSFLASHARGLLCVAHDPRVRLRDIAASLDITERSAFGIITDLAEADYVVKEKDGRRNRYHIQAHLPLPEPDGRERAIGEVLALLVGVGAAEGDGAQVPVAFLGLGASLALAGLVVLRGAAGPGGQVRAGAEPGHIHAGFGHGVLRGAPSPPGHRLGLGQLLLVQGQQPLDHLGQIVDAGGQPVDAGEDLGQQGGVLIGLIRVIAELSDAAEPSWCGWSTTRRVAGSGSASRCDGVMMPSAPNDPDIMCVPTLREQLQRRVSSRGVVVAGEV